MGLEYFPCYHSYAKKCEKLTDQELGRLFRALMQFSETGELQELAGRESIAFDFIADDIARAKDAYDAKCRKNKSNIEKRYATGEYERIETNTGVYETYQNKSKNKDKSKDKTPKGVSDTRTRFVPPTLEEVTEYAQQRNSPVDPVAFWEYFNAGEWRDSKGEPVRNWKQKLITWEKHEPKRQEQPKSFADMWREMPDE